MGATGSIGDSVCDLVRQHPDKFQIIAMVAHKNIAKLAKLAHEFQPKYLGINDVSQANQARLLLKNCQCQLFFGENETLEIAKIANDLTIHAIVGMAGLPYVLESLKRGYQIALANKESLIAAGEILLKLAKNGQILPIDSEHNAIFQCLNTNHEINVEKLTLTASGGPFWQLPSSDFAKITKAQALKHPNWSMGAKITIDSATLMNKGLEIIEAHYLFNMAGDKLCAVIHPQSVVHSLVHYDDGSVLAQMGMADMRIAISYILNTPNRTANNAPRLNLTAIQNLNFYEIDEIKFPCFKLAKFALNYGKSAPLVLNAANEWAVAQFLTDKIAFNDIAKLVEIVLDSDFKQEICANYPQILALQNEIIKFCNKL